jgi:hypothetical protein
MLDSSTVLKKLLQLESLVGRKNRSLRVTMIVLLIASHALAAGAKKAAISVSAVIAPRARLEVKSSNSITIRATMFPNAQIFLWTDTDACGAALPQRVVAAPGVYGLLFGDAEVVGKNLICARSNDGTINVSAPLAAK